MSNTIAEVVATTIAFVAYITLRMFNAALTGIGIGIGIKAMLETLRYVGIL